MMSLDVKSHQKNYFDVQLNQIFTKANIPLYYYYYYYFCIKIYIDILPL